MLLAGTSFTLQYRVFAGRPLSPLRDCEFLFYFTVCAVGTLLIALTRGGGEGDETSLRRAAFQATSLISSTGFASTDYNLWPDSSRALLVVLMIVGGCAGSAAGGPKAIRFVLVWKRIGREITRVLHPRAVLPIRYGERTVDEEVMRAVFTLVVLYLTGHFVIGAALVVLGADLVTGFTASLACLGNIGPAFGSAGPMGHYADFSALSKLLLVFAMWIGRLEIVTVLALLHHDVWRHLRLRA
jgi:trk system potassium uptake protein TrkH